MTNCFIIHFTKSARDVAILNALKDTPPDVLSKVKWDLGIPPSPVKLLSELPPLENKEMKSEQVSVKSLNEWEHSVSCDPEPESQKHQFFKCQSEHSLLSEIPIKQVLPLKDVNEEVGSEPSGSNPKSVQNKLLSESDTKLKPDEGQPSDDSSKPGKEHSS